MLDLETDFKNAHSKIIRCSLKNPQLLPNLGQNNQLTSGYIVLTNFFKDLTKILDFLPLANHFRVDTCLNQSPYNTVCGSENELSYTKSNEHFEKYCSYILRQKKWVKIFICG